MKNHDDVEVDDIEKHLNLLDWSDLDKETVQMILDLGDEDELLQE